MAEKKAAIASLVCECGEVVSGPDAADVEATMERHKDKKHKAETWAS